MSNSAGINGLSCDSREYTTVWRAIQHFHNVAICFHFSHLSFLALSSSVLIFCFQSSGHSSVPVFKETQCPLLCLITAVCVFGPLEKWWKLEPCFTLSAESRSCFVWGPKAMSQTSCLFIYQPLSEIYSPLVSIDSAHHFCSPPAETQTWSWSRDGDSEQRGGTRLFPLKRLKRKFADV